MTFKCYQPVVDRLWGRIEVGADDECWEWHGNKSRGYGQLRVNGKQLYAHRVVYEMENGPIPEGSGYHGICVLHRCDNRACCNPAHLFLGTAADNVADMLAKGRERFPTSETAAARKLTPDQVAAIRILYAAGGVTQKQLAARFGVAQTTISRLITRRYWKNAA